MKKNSDLIIFSASSEEKNTTYSLNEDIFRFVSAESYNSIEMMFKSGLVDSLVAEGLLVQTEIVEKDVAKKTMLLKHKRVKRISYAREWTLLMYLEAALLVLRLNKFCLEFGFKTIDCHPNNILYDGSRPVYVDFGSFVYMGSTYYPNLTLPSYSEFMRSYYYPIKIWERIGVVPGMLHASRIGFMIEPSVYYKIFFYLTRFLKPRWIDSYIKSIQSLRSAGYRNINFNKLRYGRFLCSLIHIISRPQKINYLFSKISSIHEHQYKKFASNPLAPISSELYSLLDKILMDTSEKSILEICFDVSYLLQYDVESFDKTLVIAEHNYASRIYLQLRQLNSINLYFMNPFIALESRAELSIEDRLYSGIVVLVWDVAGCSPYLKYRKNMILNQLRVISESYLVIIFPCHGSKSKNLELEEFDILLNKMEYSTELLMGEDVQILSGRKMIQ